MPAPHSQFSQSTVFFYALLIVVVALSIFLLKNFLSTIVLAGIFAIILQPVYTFLKIRCKIPSPMAITISVLTSILLIVVPIITMLTHLTQEVIALTQTIAVEQVPIPDSFPPQSEIVLFIGSSTFDVTQKLVSLNTLLDSFTLGSVQITLEQIEDGLRSSLVPLRQWALSTLVSVGSSSLGAIARVFLFIIILVALIPNLGYLRQYLKEMSPLDDTINEMYLKKITAMTMAMVRGTVLIAIVQSLLATFMLWILGVEYLVTLAVLMFFLSILPVVGTPMVTLPIGIILLLNGQLIAGLAVIIIQIFFISNVDNILRPRLVSKDAMLHPALLLLGVFGGFEIFGFLGVVYGPVIMIMLDTTLSIYLQHYQQPHQPTLPTKK